MRTKNFNDRVLFEDSITFTFPLVQKSNALQVLLALIYTGFFFVAHLKFTNKSFTELISPLKTNFYRATKVVKRGGGVCMSFGGWGLGEQLDLMGLHSVCYKLSPRTLILPSGRRYLRTPPRINRMTTSDLPNDYFTFTVRLCIITTFGGEHPFPPLRSLLP